jgi:hypothetical protein
MTRSEFLGTQQCREQIGEQAGGDRPAEDEVEHRRLYCRSQKKT